MLPGLWACPPQSQGMDTDTSPLGQWHVLQQCQGTPNVPGACPSANTLQAEARSPTSTLSTRDPPWARPGTASDASAGLRLSQVSGKGSGRPALLPRAEGHLCGPRLLTQMTVASEQRAPAPPAFLTRGVGLGHRCLSLPHSGLEKGGGGNGASRACTSSLALLDE